MHPAFARPRRGRRASPPHLSDSRPERLESVRRVCSYVLWNPLRLRKTKEGRRSSFRPATIERRNRHSRRLLGLQRQSAPRLTQLTASLPSPLTTAHLPHLVD